MSDKTQDLIGKCLPDGTGRDAIHVAVAPAIAGRELFPAQRVGIDKTGHACPLETPVGIVDPFLTHPIFEGARFFIFLFPNTITALRHVWTHPAFGEEGATPAPAPAKKPAPAPTATMTDDEADDYFLASLLKDADAEQLQSAAMEGVADFAYQVADAMLARRKN